MSNTSISIVIACYNEEEIIEQCHESVVAAVAQLPYEFEFIYVDDGSTDQTRENLKKIHLADDRVTIISLSRNFGKEAAMTAGLDIVKGDAVIILDADLQDPPELIPELIDVWKASGADIVYGQRLIRDGETWFKKMTATCFYRVINVLSSHVTIPKNTGDFRLMNMRAVKAIRQLKEQHRFMKGLFAWIGYKQVAFQYNREPRIGGETKWNYMKLGHFAIEGITSFSISPLRLASIIGITVSLLSFLFGAYIFITTLIYGPTTDGWPSLMVTISFLSGIQLLSIGVLGEYIGRIFGEVKRRPIYFIDAVYSKNNKNPSD